ncbi:MAG: hypothetical protein ACI4AL_11865 [Aristaeellaceae bacterium]
MATSSIFRAVNPKDKNSIRKLVQALEYSKATKAEDVQMTRSVSNFTTDQIRKAFGDSNEGLQDRKP